MNVIKDSHMPILKAKQLANNIIEKNNNLKKEINKKILHQLNNIFKKSKDYCATANINNINSVKRYVEMIKNSFENIENNNIKNLPDGINFEINMIVNNTKIKECVSKLENIIKEHKDGKTSSDSDDEISSMSYEFRKEVMNFCSGITSQIKKCLNILIMK